MFRALFQGLKLKSQPFKARLLPNSLRVAKPFAFVVAGVGLGSQRLLSNQDQRNLEKDIEDLLDDDTFDDGSWGPVFVRLAWHASGTFDAASGTGGSNGATMRFAPESTDGANAGLDKARARLEVLKAKYPGVSYADLWTLAGVVAIRTMGGPSIPWTSGRTDLTEADASKVPPNGRLPNASLGAEHIRDVFYRMGFNDQEIVALSGAHSLGRCHTDRSGFEGPWTYGPTTFSNEYFRMLLEEKWTERQWNGPRQFENPKKDLMMLPTDLVLIHDKSFRPYVDLYAKDKDQFNKDFAKAAGKLFSLGVPTSH